MSDTNRDLGATQLPPAKVVRDVLGYVTVKPSVNVVYHRSSAGQERFCWWVYVDGEPVDEFTQYREAVRFARQYGGACETVE